MADTETQTPSPSPPPSPPSETASPTGSSARADLICPYCGRECKTEGGLNLHIKGKHPDQKPVEFGDGPRAKKPPEPPKPPQTIVVDLTALETETANSVLTLGQLLHGALFWVKMSTLTHPDRGLPPLDTHLAWALQLRSKATAHILVQHAQHNETLMRVVNGLNGLFKGGETATLVASLGLAAAATIGAPTPGIIQGAVNQDVLEEVEKENAMLAEMIRRAREEQERAAA